MNIDKIYESMAKHDFEPFKKVKLWIMISPFGGGKERLLKKVVEYMKAKQTVHQIRSESIKSISYLYDDKRLRYLKQLEASPLLVLVIDNIEERTKTLTNSIIKSRRTQGKLTIILTELERDDFDTHYPGLLKIAS